MDTARGSSRAKSTGTSSARDAGSGATDLSTVRGRWISSALKVAGGHLFIGPAGYTLHYGKGSIYGGYDTAAMKALCAGAGVPVIDARDLLCEVAWKLACAGPMTAVGHPPSEPPYGPLSHAPLAAVADAYRAAGAEVLNLPGTSAAGAEA